MFNIGDKIFYPMHGAGVIEKIEEKEILNEKISYYIIKLPGEVTVMVPTNNVEKLGLRPIISEDEAKSIISSMADAQIDTELKWSDRYNDNKERLKTGDIAEIADIYRELSYRNRIKNLSTSEKKMYLNTKNVLFSELSQSTNMSYEQLDELLENKFNTSFKEYEDENN